ncbi:hypothetical protein D3C78_1699380 [compost metagenome]
MCTGLKKCMPQKFSGRFSPAASRSIEMVEVLVARMVSAPTCASTSASTACLTLGFSTTASITMSTWAKSP